MAIANYHIHSTMSDGLFTPEQVVQQAVEHGMKYIALTDHHPLPSKEIGDWEKFTVSDHDFERLQELKRKYEGQIDLALGIEMDWFEAHQDFTREELQKRDYDFVIGSIHFMPFQDSLRHGPLYKSGADTKRLIESYGSMEELLKNYYSQMRLMTDSGLFDSMGHIDRIRSITGKLDTRGEEVQQSEIERTLSHAKESGIAVEVNTYSLEYPQSSKLYFPEDILPIIKRLEIPITIGNDGHSSITRHLNKGFELVKEAGIKTTGVYQNRERSEIIF